MQLAQVSPRAYCVRPGTTETSMRKLSIIAIFCTLAGTLSAQELRIVNAASLSSVSLSPGSIFTVFGTNLASGVSYASNVQTPPASLGGVTVTIGGEVGPEDCE